MSLLIRNRSLVRSIGSPVDPLPYREDAIIYINADFENDFTFDGSNRISNVINRVDSARNASQTNNTYKPIWDAVNNRMILSTNSQLIFAQNISINMTDHSFFIRASHDGNATTSIMLTNSSASFTIGGDRDGLFYDGWTPPTYAWLGGGLSTISYRDDATSMYLKRGSLAQQTRATLHTPGTDVIESIGHAIAIPTQTFAGNIHKIVAYNRFLSDSERDEVAAYLALNNN